MRELKVSVPSGQGKEIARLAIAGGASYVAVSQAQDAHTSEEIEEVRIRTSTPTARRVFDSICLSPLYGSPKLTLSSHDMRALITSEDMPSLTRPFCMPLTDVYE